MISRDRLSLIEEEIEKDLSYISELTDAELVSLGSYLAEQLKNKRVDLSNKRINCQNLLNNIRK